MAARQKCWWLVMVLLALMGAGCAGILKETRFENGREDRLRIQSGESWKSWDRNPTKGDAGSFMLKKESTF